MGIPIASTVTVINKSGKVVSTSKHFNSLWKDARAAYREKKAEIKAARDDDFERQLERIGASEAGRSSHAPSTIKERPRREREGGRRRDLEEESSRHRKKSGAEQSTKDTATTTKRERVRVEIPPPPTFEYARDSSQDDSPVRTVVSRSQTAPTTPLTIRNLEQFQLSRQKGLVAGSARVSPTRGSVDKRSELIRRHSDMDVKRENTLVASIFQTNEADSDVDSALAYGELPGDEEAPPLPLRHTGDEEELREKVTGLQRLLDEADCLQYSAQAVAKNLEDNPEAMAAVALTLAEISKLMTKIGPVALTAVKGSFPAIAALLLSPEFLIAGGVALGVTVVSFGGYKIVQRIKASKASKMLMDGAATPNGTSIPTPITKVPVEEDDGGQELVEIDRIEQWRRGVSFDPDTASVGTSVEGEFATPAATKRLREEGMLSTKPVNKEKDKKPKEKERSKDKEKEKEKSKDKEKDDKKKKHRHHDHDEKKKEKKERERSGSEEEKGTKVITYRESGANTPTTTFMAEAAQTAATLKTLLKKAKEKTTKGEVVA